jgi:hypothetical protein
LWAEQYRCNVIRSFKGEGREGNKGTKVIKKKEKMVKDEYIKEKIQR